MSTPEHPVERGAPVAPELLANRHRLKRLWYARRIDVLEAVTDPPPSDTQESSTDSGTSDADPPLVNPDLLPEGATVERRGVAWFIVTLADGTEHKAHGKAKLDALLADLNAQVA